MRWTLVVVLAGCGFQPSGAASDAALIDATRADVGAPSDAAPDAPAIAITEVQSATSEWSDSGMQAGYDHPQTAGNLDVVAIGWSGGATTISIHDTERNAYVSLGMVVSGSITQAVFYAPHIAGAGSDDVGGNVVTATFADDEGNGELRMIEYAGLADDPLDGSAAAKGTGRLASASLTTTHAHELIFVAETSSGEASGPGSGFIDSAHDDGDVCEHREVHATGSYTATVPLQDSESWIALVVAFVGRS